MDMHQDGRRTEQTVLESTGHRTRSLQLCRRSRRQFYERIAAAVASSTRPTVARGIAWPTRGSPQRYNHLVVEPYVGSFDTQHVSGEPIPRIVLNRRWLPMSRAQVPRWTGRREGPLHLDVSHHSLELTVGIAELPDFAPWVLGWLQAVEANDVSLMPAPPHRLAGDPTPTDLLVSQYEWSHAAHTDHALRRQRSAETTPQVARILKETVQ